MRLRLPGLAVGVSSCESWRHTLRSYPVDELGELDIAHGFADSGSDLGGQLVHHLGGHAVLSGDGRSGARSERSSD